MRSLLFAITSFLLTSNIQAQEQHPIHLLPDIPKSEIGIFAQSDITNNTENFSYLGLMYSKPLNNTIAIRAIFAYTDYNNSGAIVATHSLNDTALEQKTITNIHLGVAGLGIVAQRHFYKHVYLFAGLELRGGYGVGTNDTINIKQFSVPSVGSYTSEQNGNSATASMLYVGVVPSIGAKLQFNHISLGLEVSGMDMSYKNLKIANSRSGGTLDLSSGKLNNRVFINFRI